MRQVFLGIFLTLVYSFFGAIILMSILTPIVQIFHYFYNGWAFEWNASMSIGVGLWTLAVIIILFLSYFSESNSRFRKFTDKRLEKIHMSEWLIIQWIIAIYKRIYLQIEFTGNISDGYLKKDK